MWLAATGCDIAAGGARARVCVDSSVLRLPQTARRPASQQQRQQKKSPLAPDTGTGLGCWLRFESSHSHLAEPRLDHHQQCCRGSERGQFVWAEGWAHQRAP